MKQRVLGMLYGKLILRKIMNQLKSKLAHTRTKHEFIANSNLLRMTRKRWFSHSNQTTLARKKSQHDNLKS